MVLDTVGVVVVYTLWFVLTFSLAVLLLKINSKK